MKTDTKLATLFVASTLFAAVAAPAFAASPLSASFVANARPNVDFLDRSSRLALTRSTNPRLKAFAHSEALEQTITANSLVAFSSANSTPVIGSTGDGPLAPVATLATLPLDVAANVTTGVVDNVDNVLTGRSVAIDDPLAPRRVVPAPAPLLASGSDDLARLDSMSGRAFDALYRTSQLDALRQLSTLYRDYQQNGDDAALRDIAIRDLPKINRRIAELKTM